MTICENFRGLWTTIILFAPYPDLIEALWSDQNLLITIFTCKHNIIILQRVVISLHSLTLWLLSGWAVMVRILMQIRQANMEKFTREMDNQMFRFPDTLKSIRNIFRWHLNIFPAEKPNWVHPIKIVSKYSVPRFEQHSLSINRIRSSSNGGKLHCAAFISVCQRLSSKQTVCSAKRPVEVSFTVLIL